MKFHSTYAFARRLDLADPLRKYRKRFFIPEVNGKPCLYFTGNSLGLQPKSVQKFVFRELSDWSKLGVEGHFHAQHPWLEYHKFSQKALAAIVGAKPLEVVAMNQLTVNLHLMLTSFYRPTKKRFKIITEAGAFSSDQYAFESQISLHGLSPADVLIEIAPKPGESILSTDDITKIIETHQGEVALVIFGAVQYYSGQFFDLKKITESGHRAGAYVGFDLAHAIGNVPLRLHDHDVDFAVWCGYKYLNSGPGGIAGAFVHEKYATRFSLPRLAGWWGHNEKERFEMKKGFKPIAGAAGWQISNFPVLLGAAQQASLEIFSEVGMNALRKKSILLTAYLEFLLQQLKSNTFTILTPGNPAERGCQLSILMKKHGKMVFAVLTRKGVQADWREPDVIRVAPVPLYNSFEDVFLFAQIFKEAIEA